MAAESEMRDFTRRLFQGSRDLRALTLSMVRGEFLAHVGRETLLRDEKLLLRRVVEEELLAMQLEDSSADGGSPAPGSARHSPAAGAATRCCSDSSPDRARKKPRVERESEDGSDGEDSGIDSKKPKPAPIQGDDGKSGCTGSWEDEGDSGAEETPDQGSSSSESNSEWAAESKARRQPLRRGQKGTAARSQPGWKRPRGMQCRGDSEEQGRVRVQGEQKSARRKGARQAEKGSKLQGTEEPASKGKQVEWRREAEEAGGQSESEVGKDKEEKGLAEPVLGGARKRRPKAQSEESGSEEPRESRKPAGQKRSKTTALSSDSEGEELRAREKASGSKEEEEQQQHKGLPRRRGSSERDSSSSVQEEEGSPGQGSRRQKEKEAGPARDHPAVQRLKRYILACGVRRNYKKLLAGCRSTKQRVRVLRQELEAIGLQGNPSLERCRALRLRREEAAEVAALDVGNIIASEGRPRRRNIWSLYSSLPTPAGASPPQSSPPRDPVDWSSLRGVISSDAESD